MSSVAWLKYLITVLSFIMTIFTCTAYMQKNKKHMVGCHSKFWHDLPTNKTDAESQFFVEMEMNQHFAKKSATHF
jgi:hypothetical protein